MSAWVKWLRIPSGRPQRPPSQPKSNASAPAPKPVAAACLIYLALDKAEGLRHGLFAKGILGMGKSQVMAVPLSAVRTDRAQPYVQVVEQVGDATASERTKPSRLGVRGMDLAQPESETMVGCDRPCPKAAPCSKAMWVLCVKVWLVKYTAAAANCQPASLMLQLHSAASCQRQHRST